MLLARTGGLPRPRPGSSAYAAAAAVLAGGVRLGPGTGPEGPMRRGRLVALGLLALFGAAPAEARGRPERGVAVWYGEDRHGRTMANGRAFDQWAMTGASARFPLGTRVRVTDLDTRKGVVVTVTDRTIPNSRVLIDLSRGAARALGIEAKGKARVEAVPVGFDRSQTRRQGSAR